MTLDCVCLTQSSVIRIIFRNVGLKHFFHLRKFLLLSLVFAYISIVCRVCQWKNFENRSIIGEDMDRSKVARFLWPMVYTVSVSFCIQVVCIHHAYGTRAVHCVCVLLWAVSRCIVKDHWSCMQGEWVL